MLELDRDLSQNNERLIKGIHSYLLKIPRLHGNGGVIDKLENDSISEALTQSASEPLALERPA